LVVKMEAIFSSEIFIYFQRITRRYILENRTLLPRSSTSSPLSE
jgi:hypothetical protein